MSDHDEGFENPRSAPPDVPRALAQGEQITAEQLDRLRRYLVGSISSTFHFEPAEELDIVDAAIASFAIRATQGAVRPETAMAYLRRSVRNEAISRLRRAQNLPLDDYDEWVEEVDEIARYLDSSATAESIQWLIDHLESRGEQLAVLVLTTFLRICELDGIAPSARRIGLEIRRSHPTVSSELQKCRDALLRRGQES